MGKASIAIFLIVLAVFGTILYITQKDSLKKSVLSATQIPSLPPAASVLNIISRPPAQQGATQQQAAANQQQQAQPQQQQQQAQVGEMGPPKASMSAMIRTTKGTITISLVLKDAPYAINNFINKARSNYWNGLTFHRVEDWVIQGGDPTGTGTGGSPFQSELNAKPFTTGAVGWAASSNMQVGQGARISNDSQFFIVKQDASWLNGQYTNFATVTDGMDVVNKIQIGDKILGITVN